VCMLESLWKMAYNSLKLRFGEAVFIIHHVSSCALSIWQDGGGIPNHSNVVVAPLPFTLK
jgi:hypothetical protein